MSAQKHDDQPDIKPGLYTIPAGRNFAADLAGGLMHMAGDDPLSLADMTLLLPTRRACRTVREAFLSLSGGTPLLLPQMRPLSDADPDEMAITLAADMARGEGIAGELLDIPPAISLLRRRLVLARLVRKLPLTAKTSADQAVGLAAELAKLLDEIQTEGLSFDRLHGLVPEDYSKHWQITIDFLRIVSEHWPDALAEEGVIDPADRRNRVLEAQRQTWLRHPPQHKIIAAGSTGTIPAAAKLLKVVASLPQGYVVLPGLDTGLDDDSWAALEPTHPQFGLRHLLESEDGLAATRADVRLWPGAGGYQHDIPGEELERRRQARVRLLSETMRPAETSEHWQSLGESVTAQALDGLQRIDCANPQEEADVIALMMRHALEVPGKTAALVTPDRFLARRVAMSLRRWGIEVDDSGGQSLPLSRAGGWLRLCARALLEGLAPVDLLACLRHPLASAGMAPADYARHVDMLERYVLRGLRPGPGFEGLRNTLADRAKIPHKVPDAAREKLEVFITRLEDRMAPLRDAFEEEHVAVEDMLTAHLRVAESMAATDEKDGASRIWTREDGEAAAAFAAELETAAAGLPPVDKTEYCGLVDGLMRGVMVRPRYGFHPRLAILGILEARLFQADLMILGGMNEGTWPPDPGADPWMSRPMRQKFELPSPDFAVGLAAHDFVQCAAAPDVVLTRSEREGGAPSVPSRWLDRLDTVLRGAGLWEELRTGSADTPWRGWAALLDKADKPAPCAQPIPKPPVDARPRELAVTRIGAWMRDPYQVYARHILKLFKLDDLDAAPGAAERGTFMHEALAAFIKKHPDDIPEDALKTLCEYGEEAFGAMLDNPEVYAFWWPRFQRMAREFLKFEREWREQAKPAAQELKGSIRLQVATGDDFTLSGTADRIDRMDDGTIAIIDYKTGGVPKDGDIVNGLDPQLPLEALIAENGGFPGIDAARIGYIGHWQVSGGATPFAEKPVKDGREIANAHDLAQQAYDGLVQLVEHFDDPDADYRPVPRPDYAPRYNDYAHLARIAEWSVAGGEDEA